MKTTIIIPARYGSSRFEGKPLYKILGKEMVVRVADICAKVVGIKNLYVATDNKRISKVVMDSGYNSIMTSSKCLTGTDRVAEAAMKIKSNIYVNVQGDEPLIPPQVIDQVAANLESHPAAGVSTLSEPIETLEDFLNPNVVKVVGNHCNFALLFTRAPVPWPRDDFIGVNKRFSDSSPAMRHIGLYAYRVGTLNQFVAWPRCEIECAESLEQLRFMYHGINIHIDTASHEVPPGVDTEDDLRRLDEVLKNKHN